MKAENIRILQEPNKSFIVYHEKNAFSQWHYHPEYELVLILNGKGQRMVGDHIGSFEENDLVLLGPYLPHEWSCNESYFSSSEGFKGEGIVIQFLPDFLGSQFFDIPENKSLREVLQNASRGINFSLKMKGKIIPLIHKIAHLKTTKQLYTLFTIFKIISESNDYSLFCSPLFTEPEFIGKDSPMQKAVQYILLNFQKDANVKGALEYTNMSHSAFCKAFKKNYQITFKEYLLSIRIGYACNLLADESFSISEIAYNSGFENISNFNRQFKKLKNITPSRFTKQHNSLIYQQLSCS